MSTAPPDGPPAAPAPTGVFTRRQLVAILTSLMLGVLLASLDQTIVATAIRTIADDLHGLDQQAWATTAYLLTSTVSTPLYGKLSDLYGRRPFFLTAISIFMLGSALCTISTSMLELAVFRALQGLGAGGLMSLALAIVGDIATPRERARYQGYFLAVFGTSSVVGPLVGGAFAGADSLLGLTGWRWVFLVNVPVALAALVVVARVLRLPHAPRRVGIDWWGGTALVVFIVAVLIVAEQGRSWGWSSAPAILGYVVAGVGLIAFLAVEKGMGDAALIPLRLFRSSTFALSSAAGVVIGMGMFGAISVLPQYLQIVRGATPATAGLLMLPMVVGLMVASVVAGRLTGRTGHYKGLLVVGSVMMVLALALMWLRLDADTALWETDVYMALLGLGIGNCVQNLTLAAQNAAPARDMGVTTSSSTMFRQLGGALGTAVFFSVLFSAVTDRISRATQAIAPTPTYRAALADPGARINPANRAAFDPHGTEQVLTDSSFLQHMDARLARPFLVGFSQATDTVFLVAACIVAIAVVLLAAMPEQPLRSHSGIAARGGSTTQDPASSR